MRRYFYGRLRYSENMFGKLFILVTLCVFARGQLNETTTVSTYTSDTLHVTNAALVNNGSTCHGWWENEGRSSLEEFPIAQYTIAILQSVVVLITIAGNLLVIIAVSTFHELQTITNMFVASLACADLIMGAFVMPIGIPYVTNGRWGLGSLFCDIWISIDVLVVTASIETLCAIALDRYLAITKPFTYTKTVTRSRARLLIAFIWITAASIAFIPVQLGWWKVDSFEAVCCYDTAECCEFMTNKTYAIVSSAVSFYIPTALMIFSYAIVFKEAIRLASQIDGQSGMIRRASMPGTNRPLWSREQRRTVFTFGYIMGIFTICWLPFFIINPAQAISPGIIPSSVFTSLNWLGYANSFFNPFIYSHNAQFRQAFLRLLTCLPCSEGFQRTKRASLSDSFPRYRSSSRGSTIQSALSSFFLSGGTSRKRSTSKSTASTNLKRNSTTSGRSPNRSPLRNTRFHIGSDERDYISVQTADNNNDSDNDVFKKDSHRGTPVDSSPRSGVFLDSGFYPIMRNSNTSINATRRKSQDTASLIHNGNNNLNANNSPTVLRASLENSLNEKSGNSQPKDQVISNGNLKTNGCHQICTRRSKSLFVTVPDGIYMRNCVSSSGRDSNSSTTDLNLVSVGDDDTALTAIEPILSTAVIETTGRESSETPPK